MLAPFDLDRRNNTNTEQLPDGIPDGTLGGTVGRRTRPSLQVRTDWARQIASPAWGRVGAGNSKRKVPNAPVPRPLSLFQSLRFFVSHVKCHIIKPTVRERKKSPSLVDDDESTPKSHLGRQGNHPTNAHLFSINQSHSQSRRRSLRSSTPSSKHRASITER